MHKHTHCQHELKHCEYCDVVYCAKCKQEWGAEKTVYVQQPISIPSVWAYPALTPPYIVTCGESNPSPLRDATTWNLPDGAVINYCSHS